MEEKHWKVLLIDDEADIREVMSIAIGDAGYRVLTAADGAAGVRLCLEESPQIVVTDIRMPNMDGLQVLGAVKKMNPEVEVIVITAFGDMDLAIRALQLDASDFITKPVSETALHLALKRARSRFLTRKKLQDHADLLSRENAKTTQELIRNISFHRNLIESSMDGIIGFDASNMAIIYNRSMEGMLGFSKSELLHRMKLYEFFPAGEAERLLAELDGDRFGGKNRLFLYETGILNKDRSLIPVQVSAVRLFDQGRRSGLVLFFRDIQELKRLERELEDQAKILHQDKMMSLGRLAASVVHEINNPISGILNYIRLMLRIVNRGALAEEQRQKFQQYLSLVENETDRCSKIVSSLLTFSRKSPSIFQKVSIDELIERCKILSAHKLELQNIRLESSIDPDIPAVEGDFNQLQQCLINLIFNAVDAMPKGGTLSIEGRYDRSASCLKIVVADTGEGISEADLPHIFEPFFTTKKDGSAVGLGLSTVYGLMERHGGSVQVQSCLGKGSVFTLQLPVFNAETEC
ncbi:MAG: hybrid sensor histidine kinase/response regulator [Desulfobacteraceae bacterium]|nr:MAG: hybrid sensor histidine kinase/response regulator [Desulfobacteraceae bacterium]